MVRKTSSSTIDEATDWANDPMLTYTQLAAIAGCSTDTIERAARRGEIEVIRLSPRRRGIRKSEGKRFLASRTA